MGIQEIKRLDEIQKDVDDISVMLFRLKDMVEDFLRPQIRFYIEDELIRRIDMKDTEQATATIELDDAKGFPTGGSFDQPPVWTEDQKGAVIAITPSADGLSCLVKGVAPGNANLSVAGVAGGTSFSGSVPVPITAGAPTQIKVSLGAASPQ